MEEWQQWQAQADEVARALRAEIDALEGDFFPDEASDERNFRGFWPRFRDLKEKVRTAPAIKLEDKLALERRLRTLGNRAYRAQEESYARSSERRAEILPEIERIRAAAEAATAPRALRDIRKELDAARAGFDTGTPLVPADRQAVWDAWRAANDFVWQRLNELWTENESYLRSFLKSAREAIDAGNGQAARAAVSKFFDSLRTHEAKQASVNAMKNEADDLRRALEEVESRRQIERQVNSQSVAVNPVEIWRADLERNRENALRLAEEVADLEAQFARSGSILDQAMIRGNLVDKRRKLAELERSGRTLEQRIEQAEAVPALSVQG